MDAWRVWRLVGGWTNPVETYANVKFDVFPRDGGEHFNKHHCNVREKLHNRSFSFHIYHPESRWRLPIPCIWFYRGPGHDSQAFGSGWSSTFTTVYMHNSDAFHKRSFVWRDWRITPCSPSPPQNKQDKSTDQSFTKRGLVKHCFNWIQALIASKTPCCLNILWWWWSIPCDSAKNKSATEINTLPNWI